MTEEKIRKFTNNLAFQLDISDDTMRAIRLIRKELPAFLDAEQKEQREKIKTDLLAIADKGEYEDLRREVENYFIKE